jgi:hypothetical protein
LEIRAPGRPGPTTIGGSWVRTIRESQQDDGRDAHLSVREWPGLDPDHGACREDQGVRDTANPTDVDFDQLTDAQIDLLAGEAEAQDRLERGLCF